MKKSILVLVSLGLLFCFGCNDSESTKISYEIGESCADAVDFYGCNASGGSVVICNKETSKIEEMTHCAANSECLTVNSSKVVSCFPDVMHCDKVGAQVSMCTKGHFKSNGGLTLNSSDNPDYYEVLVTGDCMSSDQGPNLIRETSVKLCSGLCDKGCEVKKCEASDASYCTEDGFAMNCINVESGSSNEFNLTENQWSIQDCGAQNMHCVVADSKASCVKN